jgi:xanthine/uracil/vitamin C permease (AzgA family)
VVGFYGTGIITYQQALAAAFVNGWLFILLSLSGVCLVKHSTFALHGAAAPEG